VVWYREVHSVCSWDERASLKIQQALEQEITQFIMEAQKVGDLFRAVCGFLDKESEYSSFLWV